jgi:hypothetical protein
MTRNRLAGTLLLGLGVMTFGMGIYFLLLRPPMLPEDIQFTGGATAASTTADVGVAGIRFPNLG